MPDQQAIKSGFLAFTFLKILTPISTPYDIFISQILNSQRTSAIRLISPLLF